MADEEKKDAEATEQAKATPAKKWDSAIKTLGDKIVALTLTNLSAHIYLSPAIV